MVFEPPWNHPSPGMNSSVDQGQQQPQQYPVGIGHNGVVVATVVRVAP
jgi:hypothetical protein